MKLPKSESLILLVFIGCVALWGVTKCSAVRSDAVRRVRDLTDDDTEDRPVRRDTVVLTQPAAPPAASAPVSTERPGPAPVSHTAPPTGNAAAAPAVRPGTKPEKTPAPVASSAATSSSSDASKYSTLYVTIDGLKLRKEPGLKAALVATLEQRRRRRPRPRSAAARRWPSRAPTARARCRPSSASSPRSGATIHVRAAAARSTRSATASTPSRATTADA